MVATKIPLTEAQKALSYLRQHDLVDSTKTVERKNGFLYIPIKPRKTLPPQFQKVSYVCKLLTEKKTVEQLVDIPAHLKPLLPTSFEVVGDILILELLEELLVYELVIGKAFLQTHTYVKTVLRKVGIYHGEYRTRDLLCIAGENKTLTLHKENGVRMYIDVAHTYFSARSSQERLRVAKQVQPKERVLVMFSGCAPFSLVIAKHARPQIIVGVELNPRAHELAVQNVALNHMEKRVESLLGDVRQIVPSLGVFDRICMPLPKNASDFFDVALAVSRKGTIIHLYEFLREEEIPGRKKQIELLVHRLEAKIQIVDAVLCGQHAPYVYRVCFDCRVEKGKQGSYITTGA